LSNQNELNYDISKKPGAMVHQITNEVAVRSQTDELLLPGANEFSYLAATGREVDAISALAKQNNYTATVAAGIIATEESFKSLPAHQPPAVLHIATHGPLRSPGSKIW